MMTMIPILSILWMTFNNPLSDHRFGALVSAESSTTTNAIHHHHHHHHDSNISHLPPSSPLPPQKRTILIQPTSMSIISTSVTKTKAFQYNIWDPIKQQQGRRSCDDSLPIGTWNQLPRGGAISTTTSTTASNDKKVTPSKKKKKKKKAKKKTSTNNDPKQEPPSKQLINEKLKDEDSAAQSLGDAIRQNAHLLLNHENDVDDDDDTTTTILQSLGYAMGSSDYTTSVLSKYSQRRQDIDRLESNGGSSSSRRSKSQMAQELTSTTAVIVHYFLKSHGGIHFLQCICSLLATLAGIGGILLSQSRSLQYTLIQRTLFFGLCKHIAGVVMAIYLVARTISRPGGFSEATQSIQSLIRDPISQYVFYTACVSLWLPSSTSTTPVTSKIATPPTPQVESNGAASTLATASVVQLIWWQQYPWIPLLLVGPVVLREFISIAFVISDVLTLIIATTAGTDASTATYVERSLRVMQAIVNAGMSVLVTPNKWRSSNAVQRQAILARLVSKISLLMEVGVGMLMLADCLLMTLRYVFVNTGSQIRFYALMKSIICTRLYIGFLWVRRKNISKLVESIRGGAAEAPIYVLDVILHPTTSMGIGQSSSTIPMKNLPTQNSNPKQPQVGNQIEKKLTWIDYIRIALDMENP